MLLGGSVRVSVCAEGVLVAVLLYLEVGEVVGAIELGMLVFLSPFLFLEFVRALNGGRMPMLICA